MEQGFTAKDRVCLRQIAGDRVDAEELAPRTGISRIVHNHRRDDIHADVVLVQINSAHPGKVAASDVQQDLGGDLVENAGQVSS